MYNNGNTESDTIEITNDTNIYDNNKEDITESDTLVKQQYYLEELMLTEAETRQLNITNRLIEHKDWSSGKAGKLYVEKSSKSMVDQLREFMNRDRLKGTKGGRFHKVAQQLVDTKMEPEVIAHLAAKAIFNEFGSVLHYKILGRGNGCKRVTMCHNIGRMIHDEYRATFFRTDENRVKLYKYLIKGWDKRGIRPEHRRNHLKHQFEALHLDWKVWEIKEQIHLGYVLLCMFRDATGLLEYEDGNTIVYPSEQFLDHLKGLLPKQVLSYMLYKPMVVPPRPWTRDHLFRGGYLSGKVRRYPIIKGSGRKDIPRFLAMDWSRILPAINAIQETPWRVNKRMHEAIRWTFEEYSTRPTWPINGVGKMVSSQELKPRPRVADYDVDPEARFDDIRHIKDIRDRNRRDKSKRTAVHSTLSMARHYEQYAAIYFPHNLDNRGRAYPLPHFLNPQGPDYAKAMLEFAKGHRVETPEDLRWVAISGANSFGNDKVSLDDRVQWVHDNEEMILSIARDYQTDLRWLTTSEPFSFLRFCLEWQEFKEKGYGYVSHMVIPVDATCSGLQHYAAMLRDDIGGKSVNLIPGYARQDIYGDVAAVTKAKLERDGSSDALQWLAFGIDRKITKRQVMVVPYAGKFMSCIDYTKKAVLEKCEDKGLELWFDPGDYESNAAIILLAKYIWEAIDEVVVKGKEAMSWLTRAAGAYTKMVNKKPDLKSAYDRRMTWTTPDGFEVIHYRPEGRKDQIETTFDGRVRLTSYSETEYLNPRDMGLAVAPNFVHSLDAAHLRMTVMRGLDQGITSFAMIHDSFGVHAPLMAKFLREAVKPAFVDLYSRDVLAELGEHLSAQGVKLEDLPEPGNLDLQGVLSSEFFFS